MLKPDVSPPEYEEYSLAFLLKKFHRMLNNAHKLQGMPVSANHKNGVGCTITFLMLQGILMNSYMKKQHKSLQMNPFLLRHFCSFTK